MTTDAQDVHLAIVGRWVAALAERFPAAGVGVAGSVAAGRHGPDSDVDLLVADRSVRRGQQMVWTDEGVRVNMVCVHPDAFLALLHEDAHQFAGVRLSYVFGARVLRDPHGALAALREGAAAVLRGRQAERDLLLARLRERATIALGAVDEPVAGPRSMNVLWMLADAALLRAGRTALHKAEGLRPFDVLAEADAETYRAAEELLLRGAPPRPTLERAFAHVFG